MNVTILGAGNMGSAMAARLIDTGHHVTVWDRHAEHAEQLATLGATAAPDVSAAVTAACRPPGPPPTTTTVAHSSSNRERGSRRRSLLILASCSVTILVRCLPSPARTRSFQASVDACENLKT